MSVPRDYYSRSGAGRKFIDVVAAPLTASTLAARSGQPHNTLIIYVHGEQLGVG